MENRSFPQYRKYPHDRTYFKILSEEYFEELTLFGGFYSIRSFEAKILPDRIFIQDMLQNHNEHWLDCNEAEYKEKLIYCEKNLKKV